MGEGGIAKVFLRRYSKLLCVARGVRATICGQAALCYRVTSLSLRSH